MSRSTWVDGYEGLYKIYDDGRIESFWWTPSRFLKPSSNGDGYMAVKLHNGESHKITRIHRLVAKHFIDGYRPGLDVNHKNCNKLDNRVENLEWVTRRENILHAYKNYRLRTRAVAGVHVKSGERVEFNKVKDAAMHVNTQTGNISACCKGKAKTSKGYRWSYV